MSDSELITHIAEIWVNDGGDAIGFDYCSGKIRNKIEEIIEEYEIIGSD